LPHHRSTVPLLAGTVAVSGVAVVVNVTLCVTVRSTLR
jgi:hypothetical protein